METTKNPLTNFEVGKFYKNNQNEYIHVVAEAETTLWDKVLVAESPQDPVSLIPLGPPKENLEWKEITYKEWAQQFDIRNRK